MGNINIYEKKIKMFLFTNNYPFDKGEEFLENEIPILSKKFDITIVPTSKGKTNIIRELPLSVVLDSSFCDLFLKVSMKLCRVLWIFPEFFLFVKELIKAPKKLLSIKRIASWLSLASLQVYWFKKNYQDLIKDSQVSIILYSYWMNAFALGAGLIKEKYLKNAYAISRAHRYDLYEDRPDNPIQYIPFRNDILEKIDRIYCVSKHGQDYLQNKYPNFSNKIYLSRLGIMKSNSEIEINDNRNYFRIVTCSSIIPIKRVKLIVEVISYIGKYLENKIIYWEHFGDGPLRNDIERNAQELFNKNIVYKIWGHVSNKEVLNYYKSNVVDVFLNLSLSEGLPVSIMEALSFGIPVVATNVGGVSDLVDESVGLLIPVNMLPANIAKNICLILNENYENQVSRRKKAKERWEEKSNAIVNYSSFAQELELLILGSHPL